MCGVRGSFSDMENSEEHICPVGWDDPTGWEPERARLGEGVLGEGLQLSGRGVEEGGLEVGRRLALQGQGGEVGRLGIVENS